MYLRHLDFDLKSCSVLEVRATRRVTVPDGDRGTENVREPSTGFPGGSAIFRGRRTRFAEDIRTCVAGYGERRNGRVVREQTEWHVES